jgi:NAD(P)H-hydrate epimerase
VHLVSIGVPVAVEAPFGRIECADVAALLTPRTLDAHKGSSGHVLVVAGAPGRTGAAVLSGMGALRSGAGLCTIAPRGDARAAIDAKVLELMTAEVPMGGQPALRAVLELASTRSSAVVGPGLGLDDEGRALSRELALRLPVPAVLDADALTALGEDHAALRKAAAARVLTPHPGEASRMLGITSAQVQVERYAAAQKLAEQTGQVVVLKGARSIIAEPSGRVRVCPTGTPAMGVGGTGDVLSGVIGTLLASLPAFDAAVAGVYLHGLAGELAAVGDRGLFASDLAHALPRAILACGRPEGQGSPVPAA